RAAERGHRGAPTVLTRTRALYVGTVAKERDTATAQGEFDRFTASGAATVLASPSDDAGRGCDCVEVTSYDGTTGPTGVAATFDGAGEGMADAMLCAQVARDVMAGRFRWARGLGWLSWTGRHWKPVPEQLVHEATRHYLLAQWRAAVKRLAQARDDEERKMLEGLVAAWRATLNKGRITSITSLTQGIAGIITDPADLDRHPDLLNAGDGAVDLRTGALGPHDPDLLLTKHTTVDYDPGARHDDWAAALRAVPADVLDWVQVRYGQAATGHMTPDDVMVVQHGGGENGKTTFAAGIRGALGDYYVEISHRALLGDPSQHPTELMSFRGARVALLEELPEERRMNVTRLKSVVGTPHMKARLIRHDEVEFAATHSLFLNTNHLPVVDETDHGTWRRLARLRFPYKFRKPGETPAAPLDRAGDPNLRQRIQEGRHGQREAALAWLVAGAVRWYAADRIMPAHPDRIADDTKEWRGKTDLLLAYADDRLIFDLDAHAMVTELLGDFNTWLKAHGHREWSDKTLTSRLEEHDEFAAHDVEKRTIRGNDRLSRPTFWDDVRTEPPGMYKAWLGLRFRQTADQWPAENRRSEPVVTAVTASSDNRLEIGLSRVIKVCGNSGNKDQQLGPPDTFAEVLARAETVELCNACGEFKDGRCTCGEPCPRCRWPAGSIGHHDDCGAEATS
ncbi:MAG: phage/plasmid primase, P4 family, partial [Sporichthyaceae bacterium]